MNLFTNRRFTAVYNWFQNKQRSLETGRDNYFSFSFEYKRFNYVYLSITRPGNVRRNREIDSIDRESSFDRHARELLKENRIDHRRRPPSMFENIFPAVVGLLRWHASDKQRKYLEKSRVPR